MNDLERFAYSVEYTTGKKRGRHPVFSSNQFYPYAAERRLQNALKNELEAYIGETYEVAISGESLVTDSLEDLLNMPDDISENLQKEISYAADSIARKVSGSIVEMTEMTIGKPYYPPEAKKDMLTTWEANFQTLCKSAKSDIKKEMSLLVQQAKNEGWNNKQLIREIRKKLPEKYAGRAENIARTETGKLNTAITLETYKEIGVQYYVWMATMDERTRSDHAMMNGLICSASDPTVWYEENPDDPMHPVEHKRDDTMVHLHPGEDFQCRCTMVMWDPVVDGKYDVKQRPDEENNEENEGNQGNASGNQGNASGNREIEKANRTIAEQKNALETTKNTLETTRNELTRERNARKTAELSKKNAETRISEQKAENAKLREEKNENARKMRHAEKIAKEMEKAYLETEKQWRTSEFNKIIESANDAKIEKLPVSKLKEKLTEKKIIKKISGGDMTNGSCTSLALAYAGNKYGFDVLDFRGGKSCELFALDKNIEILAKAGGFVEKNLDGFENAEKLLSRVEKGKEYLFTSGTHTAIIRKTDQRLEYLELQSSIALENDFVPLTKNELRTRFNTKKSRTFAGIKLPFIDILIELDKLKNSENFKELLSYINTKTNEQKKGTEGNKK